MTLVKFKKQAPADFMNTFFNDVFTHDFPAFNRVVRNSSASVNVLESDQAFLLEFSAPGFAKENLKVKVEGDTLTVTGEAKTNDEQTERNYKRREFIHQSFSRSFTLPDNIDAEKIEGKYENGILLVTLPKKVEGKVTNVREISLN